jgi:hypothetical protein
MGDGSEEEGEGGKWTAVTRRHSKRAEQTSVRTVEPGCSYVLVPAGSARGRKSSGPRQIRRRMRYCKGIVETLGSRDALKLSETESYRLQWARSFIEREAPGCQHAENENNGESPLVEGASKKRLRSPEQIRATKRTRPTNGVGYKSFSEVAKGGLVMAVIDRSVEDGSIPRDKWSCVEAGLASVLFAVLGDMPGLPPRCSHAGWHRGRVKLIAFGDNRSLDLYKTAIGRLGEIWPGVKLDVVPIKDIPSRPRAHSWIPASPSDSPESVLKMLSVCNPDIPTGSWLVGRMGNAEGSRRQVVLLLGSDSLKMLAATGGKLWYGFGQIIVKVYKGDKSLGEALPEASQKTEEEGGAAEGGSVIVGQTVAKVGDGEEASSSGSQHMNKAAVAKPSRTLGRQAIFDASRAVYDAVENQQEDGDEEGNRTLVEEDLAAQNVADITDKPPSL